MSDVPIAAAVLAAGGGSRFGGGKLTAEFRGKPLLRWPVDAVSSAGLAPLFVIVGADADIGSLVPDECVVCDNPRWAEGLSTSIQIAVTAASETKAEGLLIALGDQPLITADVHRRLVAAFTGEADIVAATYAGRRRNPVLVGRDHWIRAHDLRGDIGFRGALGDFDATEVECGDIGDPSDIDTVSDLSELDFDRSSEPGGF